MEHKQKTEKNLASQEVCSWAHEPGITGKGPLGPNSNDEDQWVFHNVGITEVEKRMVMG